MILAGGGEGGVVGWLTYTTQACFRPVKIPLEVEKSERFCFCLANHPKSRNGSRKTLS